MSSSTVPAGSLFGMGNPLLDISVVAQEGLLEKYDLKPATAILAEDKHNALFEEIVQAPYVPDYVAGGSCQNTIRVAQWMLQAPGASVYVGCVGTDANAKTLSDCAAADGVSVNYQVQNELPTGTCAVLIKDKDRSMVARLAAANAYKGSHLDQPEIEALWKSAKYFNVEGYFLTVAPDAVLRLAQHAAENNKTFAISLSAEFICQFFVDKLVPVLENSQIVFGNEAEAAAIAKSLNWDDNTPVGVAKAIATKIPNKGSIPRTVVITCGAEDVVVAQGDSVTTFPVPKMSAVDIVDTNGAGDAFAGGFMAGQVLGASIDKCVAAGIYSSQTILKTSGTKLSGTPAFQF